MRDSLRILLTSVVGAGSVQAASDLSTLIRSADAPPALVLCAIESSNADSETLQTLQQIRSNWPGARTAVLVENEKQVRVLETAGVDTILFEGTNAAQLLKQIDELLPKGKVDPPTENH